MKKELVAKLKFWFGNDINILNQKDYEFEYNGDFVYVYKKKVV